MTTTAQRYSATSYSDARGWEEAAFDTESEARTWVDKRGGGVVQERSEGPAGSVVWIPVYSLDAADRPDSGQAVHWPENWPSYLVLPSPPSGPGGITVLSVDANFDTSTFTEVARYSVDDIDEGAATVRMLLKESLGESFDERDQALFDAFRPFPADA